MNADGGAIVTQYDLLESLSLRRRAKVAALEARAHDATLTARLLAGDAVELGRYRPRTQNYEGHTIFAIYVDDDQHTPIHLDVFGTEQS